MSKSGEAESSEGLTNTLSGATVLNEALKTPLRPNELELLAEVISALRTMKYGSVVLTVHDGHLVEVETSVRIRKNRTGRQSNFE